MGDPGKVDRMILLNDIAEMAPLSAVVNELESQFEERIDFRSLDIRQMIGRMIKDVLLHRIKDYYSLFPEILSYSSTIEVDKIDRLTRKNCLLATEFLSRFHALT